MTEPAPIQLVLGDITRIPADAIVNAANSALAGGGGVDGAIHRAGGRAIMADLERRYGADRYCPTGSAVVSDAGDLPASWVIHAVGPIWRGGAAGEPEFLASAYRTSLRLAAAQGARTVTLPAISCGDLRIPARPGGPDCHRYRPRRSEDWGGLDRARDVRAVLAGHVRRVRRGAQSMRPSAASASHAAT